jgi:hypothetical protein
LGALVSNFLLRFALEKIGGPAIFAAFDAAGTLERVEIGKFLIALTPTRANSRRARSLPS